MHAFGGAHIPISELFYTGGGSTLRGFSLNGAGPQRQVTVCPPEDPSCGVKIAVPVGGEQLLILNSELRFPLGISAPFVGGNLGGAAFYDARQRLYQCDIQECIYRSLTHSRVRAALQDAGGTGPH